MVSCKAINKVQDRHGRTIGYTLKDTDGNVMSVQSAKIKEALRKNLIHIENLKIASNGRLLISNHSNNSNAENNSSNSKVENNSSRVESSSKVEVPSEFIDILNIISNVTGLKYSKPDIKNNIAHSKLSNNKFDVYETLNSNIITVHDKDGNYEEIRSTDDANRVALKIKSVMQTKYVVITEMDIDKGVEYIANKYSRLGVVLTYVGLEKALSVSNEGLDIVIKLPEKYRFKASKQIIFYNCHVNRLSISASIGSGLKVSILDSIINSITSINAYVIIGNSHIINAVTHGDALVSKDIRYMSNSKTINYIENYEIKSSYNGIRLGSLISNNLRIIGNDLRIYNYSNEILVVNNLDLSQSSDSQIELRSAVINNINIEDKAVKIALNNQDYHINQSKKFYNYTKEKYNNNKMFVYLLNVTGLNSIIENIGKTVTHINNSKLASYKCIRPISIASNCIFKNKFDYTEMNKTVCSDHSTRYDINTKKDNSMSLPISAYDNLLDKNGNLTLYFGLCIGDNDNIDINNLILMPHNKYRTGSEAKYYDFEETEGLYTYANKLENASITIRGDIKLRYKAAEYDVSKIVYQLHTLVNKGLKLNVKYNSELAAMLLKEGVKIELIGNEESIDAISKTTMKEAVVGIKVFDKVHKELGKYSCNIYNNSDEYVFDTGYSYEIPQQIEKIYNLALKDACFEVQDNKVPLQLYLLLKMITKFKFNAEPFTSKIVDNIFSDPDIRVDSSVIMKFDYTSKFGGYIVSQVYIGYSDINKVDRYMLVTNGRKLIYMCYIGELNIVAKNVANITYSFNDVLNIAFKYINYLDIKNKTLGQTITLNTESLKYVANILGNILTRNMIMMFSDKYKLIITPYGESIEKSEPIVLKSEFETRRMGLMVDLANIKEAWNINKIYFTDNENINSIVENVESDYRNSITYLYINNKLNRCTNSLCEKGKIHKCEVSSLWSLCQDEGVQKLRDLSSNEKLTLDLSEDTLNKLLALPFINRIKEQDAIKIAKLASTTENRHTDIIKSGNNIKFTAFNISANKSKLQNSYMWDNCYMFIIERNGSAEYYVSSIQLPILLRSMQRIVKYDSEYSIEDEMKYLDKVGIFCGDSVVDIPLIIHRIQTWSRRFAGVDKENLDEDMLSEYEETMYNKQIASTLNIMSNAHETIFTAANGWNIEEKSKSSSRRRSFSRYPAYITIDMCKRTGLMYLCIKRARVTIPVFRVYNLKAAASLITRIHKEDKFATHINYRSAITNSLISHKNKMNTVMKYQYDNVSDLESYIKISENTNYTNLVLSYIGYTDNSIGFEDYSRINVAQSNNSSRKAKKDTVKLEKLNKYRTDYLLRYIELGAFTKVDKIPSGYKKIKLYSTDLGYNIAEYYNNKESKFAYDISGDMCLVSECRMSDLMDV